MIDDAIEKDIELFSRESFLYDIDRGRKGLNQGLNNGLGRADEFLHGVQTGTYYLYGAESGAGKTTIADYAHVLCPWYDAKKKKKKLKMKYFSWELAKQRKKLRWASALMSAQYQVRLPVNYLLSKGKFRCSDEHWQLCKAIEPQVEAIFSDIEMIDEPCNSRRFRKYLMDWAKQHGKFQVMQQLNEHGDPEDVITGWIPNDPDTVLEVVVDHISLADADGGMSLKQTMDAISKDCVYFRNRCGMVIVIIQQFGSDMQTTDRRKLDRKEVIPMRLDFADSKYTYRDADVVWGLICPHYFGFDEYKDYDVARLRNWYIQAFLLKNRDGTGAANYPMFMDPIAHKFDVMPKPGLDLGGFMDEFYNKADILRGEMDKTDFSDQKPKLITFK